MGGDTRTICTLTMDDDPATDGVEEYASTCQLGDDILLYTPTTNTVVTASNTLDLTETNKLSMTGTLTDEDIDLTTPIDMKRIGEGFVRACEMGKFDK